MVEVNDSSTVRKAKIRVNIGVGSVGMLVSVDFHLTLTIFDKVELVIPVSKNQGRASS